RRPCSGSSGLRSTVRMGREPSVARRVIRPWPISPLAPVMRTTGFLICRRMLAPRAAVAFSRRDAGAPRRRTRDRLPLRSRDVRALVPALPLDGADAADPLAGTPREGDRRARDLGSPSRTQSHPRQLRRGARPPPGRARGRGGGARDGVAPLAPLDRPPPLLGPEWRGSGCAPRPPRPGTEPWFR